jgi:predicted house-cleaning noncanonical NTP pyrophosphatase (MazG superfamily)
MAKNKTAEERALVLLDRISNHTSWDGETRAQDSYNTNNAVERLASVLKQGKSAATALGKVIEAFKDILTDEEVLALADARGVLQRIAAAAQIAKEQGRRLVEERKNHEAAVAKAASAAVLAAFKDVLATPAGQVMVCAATYSYASYEFKELANGKAFARSYKLYHHGKGREIEYPQDILEETLKKALGEALDRVSRKVGEEIDAGAGAAEAAQAARVKFDEAMPLLREKYGELAQRVTAELVARKLEKANKASESAPLA